MAIAALFLWLCTAAAGVTLLRAGTARRRESAPARAAQPDPLAGLGSQFLTEARYLIETPWAMAAIPDFAFPGTRGQRPADLERSLQFSAAVSRLAARDQAVQRLMIEVWHMLKARSVYQEPEFIRRVEAEIAEAPLAAA